MHYTTRRFWKFYDDLPPQIQETADRKFIQRIIGEYDLKLLIFNLDQEEIVIWRD
jgi:hypothetical protein